ncbi:MAG: SAM-dependent methyltransferase [bacterium]
MKFLRVDHLQIMKNDDIERFKKLTFNDFKMLARDSSLSIYQKIGFPDSYRAEKEEAIFNDILSKLKHFNQTKKIILDIGIGCSGLATMMVDLSRKNDHTLVVIDSKEMLDLLPDEDFIKKIPGYFPDIPGLLEKFNSKIDSILTYSVFHYVFNEGNIFHFIDSALSLLKYQGELLIGDIPNVSKRKRFFKSEVGIKYHQEFTGMNRIPRVEFAVLEPDLIDDGVIFSILHRYRNYGYDTYLLPQENSLPMANRREDILIRKL